HAFARQFGQGGRGQIGNEVAGPLQLLGQCAHGLGVQGAQGVALDGGIGQLDLDLAPQDVASHQFAQARFSKTQIFQNPQAQIQVAVVDAADFRADRSGVGVQAGGAKGGHAADHGAVSSAFIYNGALL